MWDGERFKRFFEAVSPTVLSETGGLLVPARPSTPAPPRSKMGARKGHKHEMRAECQSVGIWPRAGMGAELWLEAFREMLIRKARTPGRCPTFHSRGWGGGVGGGDGRFHPLSVLRKRAKTPAGGRERSGEVSRAILRGVPSK